MEVNPRTTDQLGRYLQQVVTYTDPELMVRSEMNPAGTEIILTVVRDLPARGISLVLTQDFLQQNQDARILEVIRSRIRYWQSMGLPYQQEGQYQMERLTPQNHGYS